MGIQQRLLNGVFSAVFFQKLIDCEQPISDRLARRRPGVRDSLQRYWLEWEGMGRLWWKNQRSRRNQWFRSAISTFSWMNYNKNHFLNCLKCWFMNIVYEWHFNIQTALIPLLFTTVRLQINSFVIVFVHFFLSFRGSYSTNFH